MSTDNEDQTSCSRCSFSCSAFMSHAAMTLTSQDITNDHTLQNQQLFNQWGCTGSNVSPQLSWKGVPEGTQSFRCAII